MPRRDLFFIELMDWVQHRHNPYYRHTRLYVTLFSWKRPSFRYYLGGAVELFIFMLLYGLVFYRDHQLVLLIVLMGLLVMFGFTVYNLIELWPDKNAIQAAKERKREQCRLEELKEHKRKRQPKRRKDYK